MLKKFFAPRSIAVIGASRERGKLGYTILANILRYKYRGKVYPVNPEAKNILGLKCYQSVGDIAGQIDLAVVVVPAAVVPKVLEECGQKNILSVIIISAGFKEVGGAGAQLEQDIQEITKKYNINLLGPNCLGILDSVDNLNASFADGMIDRGRIAFFSQSGAICTAMLDWAKNNNIGFSRFISLGNKAGITENDLLEFLANDKNTDVILGYLEGIADGRKFLEICRKVAKSKPVIILKSGRSNEGQKAISSHTGSLAGSDQVISAAFSAAGVIRANDLRELFNYAKLFQSEPLIKGRNIAIVANAGGPSVMTTDAIAQSVLRMARFSPATINKLKKGLPAAAALHNPIDVIGDARADRYAVALEAVLQDKNVNGVIVLLTPQTVTEISQTAQVVVSLGKKYKKPLCASFIGGKKVASGVDILRQANVPVYEYPEEAVDSLAAMEKYRQWRAKPKKISEWRAIDFKTWSRIEKDLWSDKGQLEWGKTEEMLKAYKIPLVKSVVVVDSATAVKTAKKFGYPIAMKVVAKKLIHKSDAGAVLVNLKNEKEVGVGFQKLYKIAKKYKGQILVQPMLRDAKEIIIGVKRDAQFGPVIMFGLGGIYVEILKDVTFRVAPIGHDEALEMIGDIKAAKVLFGVRGQGSVDVEKIADILVKLSRLTVDFPQISEIDINPAMAMRKGCLVVDARIMI
ncbi:MAG: acetate--CoA ligase family protein [Patescibacteria group bacterium]|jgi:acetyltransferase